MNEQSKVKVWVDADNIRTIDVLSLVFKHYPEYKPRLESEAKCEVEPKPLHWAILRAMLTENYNLCTVKQQSENPRNIILKLEPQRGFMEH